MLNCMRNTILLLVVVIATAAIANADESPAFRVCSDPNNLPFSAETLDGLENKIAEIWARESNLPLEYTWFPQRRGFIRNTLKAADESGQFKCDVVMGVADGFDQLMTTTPYYRSTYALVFARGRKLDTVESGQDFVDLDRALRDELKIGAFTPTPGVQWLSRHGMTHQLVGFPAMSADPKAYPGEIIEKELVAGRLDAAIVWGPIAGYFASRAQGVEIAVIPLKSEPGIQFDFAISAGVRYGDGERKEQIEQLMRKTSKAMHEVLRAYHVPLLELDRAASLSKRDDD